MLYIFFCLIPSGAESAPVQSLYFTGFSVCLAEIALQVQGAAAVGYLGLDKSAPRPLSLKWLDVV